jgi:hypothetical protein
MGSGGKRNWVGGRRPGARGLEWRGEVGWGSRESRGDDDPIAQPLSKLKKYQSEQFIRPLILFFLRSRPLILMVFTWTVLLPAM